jgi:hypothetical protein
VFGHEILHKMSKYLFIYLFIKLCQLGMYMVIRNEVKVMLFRLSAPRIFDQDCPNIKMKLKFMYIYNFDSKVFSTYIGWRVLDDFVGSY